ncbi:MAG: hypothetical protein IKA41_08880, partial [Bacteroidaceae bacterium]|nr:hypothetical protein [Bacteroidaceae bacterium]
CYRAVGLAAIFILPTELYVGQFLVVLVCVTYEKVVKSKIVEFLFLREFKYLLHTYSLKVPLNYCYHFLFPVNKNFTLSLRGNIGR